MVDERVVTARYKKAGAMGGAAGFSLAFARFFLRISGRVGPEGPGGDGGGKVEKRTGRRSGAAGRTTQLVAERSDRSMAAR